MHCSCWYNIVGVNIFLNIFSDLVTTGAHLGHVYGIIRLVLNIVPSRLLETRYRVVPIDYTNTTEINEIAEIIGRYDVIQLLLSALLW